MRRYDRGFRGTADHDNRSSSHLLGGGYPFGNVLILSSDVPVDDCTAMDGQARRLIATLGADDATSLKAIDVFSLTVVGVAEVAFV